jgi:hypothetical protein
VVYLTTQSVLTLYIVKWEDWQIVNWKGFGSKWPWPIQNDIFLQGWKNLRKTSGRRAMSSRISNWAPSRYKVIATSATTILCWGKFCTPLSHRHSYENIALTEHCEEYAEFLRLHQVITERSKMSTIYICLQSTIRGHAVALLVETLCYKPEGHGFESRWGGLFNWPKPSSCTAALGSTQPLTEMSTRNLPGG